MLSAGSKINTATVIDMNRSLKMQKEPAGFAKIRVPGSKSVSIRALLMAALAHGVSELRGFAYGEDTEAMLRICRQLGVRVE